ncbi:hypothetical protein AZE42_12171, partial [Rhizopogon vesiculosus]
MDPLWRGEENAVQ